MKAALCPNAGMIASKLAAMRPDKIASLTLIATTTSGWQMLLGVSGHPLTAVLVSSHQICHPPPCSLSQLLLLCAGPNSSSSERSAELHIFAKTR